MKCVSTLCVRVDFCLVILWHVLCFQAELSLGSILTQYILDSRLNSMTSSDSQDLKIEAKHC